ncbi:HemK2/MTQ2 family protein methyltransferase [Streptomyces sp. NPDC086023]|uniref:HemK2/MTQ2 family protein methyltransferase n=1 Tax=Streptomyces sp. NPDC086023 TaxID=3365746 RepID=UPI0037D91B59
MAVAAGAGGAVPDRLVALPGVYRPQADSRLLEAAVAREDIGPGRSVLDIGTGTGVVALRAAESGAAVTAVDASWAAVLAAWLNARLRRLPVKVRHGDFAVRAGRGPRYDFVLANPPYVPSPDAALPVRGERRAWDAGGDGRAVIDPICAAAPTLLRPGGVLLMVHSAMCDSERTLAMLARGGISARVEVRRRIGWGPVLRGRRAWLTEQGFAAPGEDREELVVIRGRYA